MGGRSVDKNLTHLFLLHSFFSGEKLFCSRWWLKSAVKEPLRQIVVNIMVLLTLIGLPARTTEALAEPWTRKGCGKTQHGMSY